MDTIERTQNASGERWTQMNISNPFAVVIARQRVNHVNQLNINYIIYLSLNVELHKCKWYITADVGSYITCRKTAHQNVAESSDFFSFRSSRWINKKKIGLFVGSQR